MFVFFVFARAHTHTHALAHTHTHTFALTHPLTHTKQKHKQVGLGSSERGVGAPPSFASRRRSVGAAWRAGEFVLLARARTHARCRPWCHPPSPQTCGQGVAAWDGSAVVSMLESHRPLGACVEHFISPAHPSPPHTHTHTHTHRKKKKGAIGGRGQRGRGTARMRLMNDECHYPAIFWEHWGHGQQCHTTLQSMQAKMQKS